MNPVVLLELARRWEADAIPPDVENGDAAAWHDNAIAKGHRECKRECADALRMLVDLMGER